jgi:hypothetical protein
MSDMLDRYGAALAIARREAMRLLSEGDLRVIQAAAMSLATRGTPAEILLHVLEAEVEDSVLPGTDLAGTPVSDLLAKLRAMSPMQHFAVIEWLEQKSAAPP